MASSQASNSEIARVQAATTQMNNIQMKSENLKLYYPIYKGLTRRLVGEVRAVDGVNLQVPKGQTLGLVGESGCGKTSIGRMVTRLQNPTAGSISFSVDGTLRDITQLNSRELKSVRRHMGMVFQDPYSSLNPRMDVRKIIAEPLILHGLAHGRALTDRVVELLEDVGLKGEHMGRFPHAFSGGQRQRIAIARALATSPEFLVADEPVSALDVSVQSEILNLLLSLQRSRGLSMLFIAHDLAVVRHVSDCMAVMYLGEIVEIGETHNICDTPMHPYTEGLLAAIPIAKPGAAGRAASTKGGRTRSSESSAGMPISYTLPLCTGNLQGAASTVAARNRAARSCGRLPFPSRSQAFRHQRIVWGCRCRYRQVELTQTGTHNKIHVIQSRVKGFVAT